VLSFYSYLILALDADTFELESGRTNFEVKKYCQCSTAKWIKGWSQMMVIKRFFLINDMLSPTYSAIRKTMYEYRRGLDLMTKDVNLKKQLKPQY
jgi:hypothetical protein